MMSKTVHAKSQIKFPKMNLEKIATLWRKRHNVNLLLLTAKGALSFYKFISAKNSKSAQAVKRHACLLLFATFSFKKRKSW